MNKKLLKNTVLDGKYESVIHDTDGHFVLHPKLETVGVIPYTIDQGLLDKIGVVKEFDPESERDMYTIISGYVSQDDGTDLVAANRLLFETLGSNVKDAKNWMFLGNIKNLSSGSIRLYCVNISDVEINDSERAQESKEEKGFDLITTYDVVKSDDALFLASYMRLFEYFYTLNLID